MNRQKIEANIKQYFKDLKKKYPNVLHLDLDIDEDEEILIEVELTFKKDVRMRYLDAKMKEMFAHPKKLDEFKKRIEYLILNPNKY